MLGSFARSVTAAAALAALLPAAPAEDLGPGRPPQRGVLLLRNGQILEGEISRVGDLYHVALPNGEIRLKTSAVESWCRSLEEGYWQKRAAMRAGNASDHLRLARWCLRHDLLGHAGRELADAMDADPEHPLIGALHRRLQMAIRPPAGPSPPTNPTRQPASFEDLDRLVRGMPSGSVETFTQVIQPLLVNHCATSGCHGPGATSEFRLERIPPGRPPGRRLTQRNLHATVPWVDRKNPGASPLLTAPIRPHGTAKAAVFTDQQAAQYQRMVDWVYHVAARQEQQSPTTVAGQRPAVAATRTGSSDLDLPEPPLPPAEDQPSAPPAAGQSPAADGPLPQSAVRRPAVKRGQPPRQFVPVDPFDPEIFNRRFFGEKAERD